MDINSFIEPVKITIPYNSELFSDEQEADLQLYYFNEADNEWYPMATTVDTETKTLSVFTDHLTVFDYKASNWQLIFPAPAELRSFRVYRCCKLHLPNSNYCC